VLVFFVDAKGAGRHLEGLPVAAGDVAGLLRHRAVPDGTPVLLDGDTMLPVEPWCSWFLHLAYDGKAAETMREYAYIVLRLAGFLQERGCDLLSAREPDLRAYREARTRLQDRPVGDSMWGKEAQLINQLYRWLVDYGHLQARPLRVGGRGRVPMAPRLRRSMDIRHMTLGQYRFFRDVGLGGQLPDSRCDDGFRGRAPQRNRAAADLALSTGMRPQEWATVLLPELGAGGRRPGEPVVFTVQACAKYGKRREVFVPAAALDSVDRYLLLERPELAGPSARQLARRRRELFVVSRIDPGSGKVEGELEGRRRVFVMAAMSPALRRITVSETAAGLEPLAVFIGRGGQMLGSSAWASYRDDAWKRILARAGAAPAGVVPARRWRWHDLRHTFALQLLGYLELQMDGEEAGAVAARRRHMAYLGGNIRHNPLLIVSRRLGHASPATTYAYLQYSDDPMNAVEAAFRDWMASEDATYAEVAGHAFGLERQRSGPVA
jgi:integrase